MTKKKLYYEQLEVLFEPKFTIYIVSFSVALTFAYVFHSPENHVRMIAWLTVFTSYLVTRYFATLYFQMNKDAAKNKPAFFENIYVMNSLYGGSIWGVSGLLFFESANVDQLAIATAIYTGVCAGSLTTNAPSIKANLSYITSLLGLGTVGFLTTNWEYRYFIGILTTLSLIGMGFGAKLLFRTIFNNIRLRFEKESLIEEIDFSNQQREVAQKQAQQAQKLASIGEMASGIAHEINNPLTIISGNLMLLRRKADMNDTTQIGSLNKCEENIDRIAKVIKSLKRMSYSGLDDDIKSS